MQLAIQKSGAEFSDCRNYRYALWRTWGEPPYIAFIGLNPSTADESANDPTIRRCIGFAKSSGFGGLYMLNLFAWRATDPDDLYEATHPVGDGNNHALVNYCALTKRVVAAWGSYAPPGMVSDRVDVVFRLLEHRSLWCLGTTKNGSPRHPLYVKASAPWAIYRVAGS